MMRARNLCRDFGYTPGTPEFARCAQTEFDRMAMAAAPMPQPAPLASDVPATQAQPQASTARPAASQPQSDDDSDWLVKWLKRPPVCEKAACSVY